MKLEQTAKPHHTATQSLGRSSAAGKRIASALALLLVGVVCHSAAAEEPGHTFVGTFHEDSSSGAANWQTLDPGSWRSSDGPTGAFEVIDRRGEYEPPRRSPYHVAVLKDRVVGDFTLTFRVRSPIDSGPHRDCCVFFGYQGPDRFYYAHLGAQADPKSGQIMVVDRRDRTPLTANQKPTPWTDDWHEVKVEREVATGDIRVYFDDMDTPLLTASDSRFAKGQIGLGSFDDLVQFDDVRLVTKPQPDPSLGFLDEGADEKDARMAWWREARFGMFVHWGLYAIPAGVWNGEPVPGIGEWIMNKASIPLADYLPLASQFNPRGYDPEAWAAAAAGAGMKYLVITSKHHDGFCLFDTAATEWDVVDATPYGADLLAPLAEACRARDVRFCVYYSILDWHHPSQRLDPEDSHKTLIDPDRKAEYIAYMKRQLAELLDSCDPDVIWFDGEWVDWWTEEDGRDLYAYLRGLKPSLLINNRVGKGRKGMEGLNKTDREYAGDFGTPEQEVPETGLPGVDWESCMTMNDTWGYKKNDENWKSTGVLVRNLIDTASKGGNYLLNVGPTAEGEIPAAGLERLAAIGRWMTEHGDAIYGCSASPLPAPGWGRYTAKGDTVFAHVFSPAGFDRSSLPAGAARVEVIHAPEP